jgi:hypothetical protein
MRKVILMLLAVLSSSAMAEWVIVGTDNNSTIYADPATIHKTGSNVTMWILTDLEPAEVMYGTKIKSEKARDEYDCKEKQVRVLLSSHYFDNMGRGEELASSNYQKYENEWRPVLPDTLDEVLFKIACGKK